MTGSQFWCGSVAATGVPTSLRKGQCIFATFHSR